MASPRLTALFGAVVASAAPVNQRYFAFSSYIGPIVNLTFDDPAVLRVAHTLGLGSLRYPGGSTTSHWNYSSGRWVDTMTSSYAVRTNAFPRGTFTPDRYFASGALGRTLRVPPIWNLNLATLGKPYPDNIADPPGQIDTLKRMGVPVEYLELDNEKADNPLSPYLASAEKVVARARQHFPSAKISIIGCFGAPSVSECMAELKRRAASGLFDAVTMHHYGPNNGTVNAAKTDVLRRSATLAPTLHDMRNREHVVSTQVSPNVSIWLDEFNWGGDWAGVMWPGEAHGGLRGLFWASYVLAAIQVTHEAKAAGRSGYDAVMSYSLFYQNSSPWSKWASCASVPDLPMRPDLVAFDGVAQIFAHFSRVSANYTDVVPLVTLSDATVPSTVPGAQGAPCVLGAEFSSPSAPHAATVMLNVCPSQVEVKLSASQPLASAMTTTYSGIDKGGFVLANQIGSIDSPPWVGGPLLASSSSRLPSSLPAITLTFVHRRMPLAVM